MANNKVTGNVAGLKPSHHRLLERTFLRRTRPDLLVGVELGRHLCDASHAIGRQVGVLIDRQGHVEHVFVGDASRIYLPDIGRVRAGLSNRRGLRHVHSVLHKEGLGRDDLADLTKLRLDAVVAIEVLEDGSAGQVHYALLRRGRSGAAFGDIESAPSLHAVPDDFDERLLALSEEEGRQQDARAHVSVGRALIVGVYARRDEARARLDELRELCRTAGLHVEDEIVQLRRQPEPRYVVGRGKLEEITLMALDAGVEVLVFDHELSPAQARAIAATSDLKVIDRTQLILDIFAQHAHSRDGKLQVELAQLKYNLSRLTDLDAGLSRLTGGIGGRGPGETKLEINRRRARSRITKLEQQIEGIGKQRGLRRKARLAGGDKIVSIVGYTNAGKSTLMRRLTQSDVLVADQLFATLDATSRKLRLPSGRQVVLTDTVGFIRELPEDLMRAFRATLEELENADLLLHVIDVADGDRAQKIQSVEGVLQSLHLAGLPVLMVLNKADTVEKFVSRGLAERASGVAISAATGEGTQELLAAIDQHLGELVSPMASEAADGHEDAD